MNPIVFPPRGPDDRVLLEEQGTIPADGDKSLRCFRFVVPAAVEALSIYMDYAPRWSRDRARNEELVRGAVDLQLATAAAAGVSLPPAYRAGALAKHASMHDVLRNLLNLVLRDSERVHRGRWDQNLGGPVDEDVVTRDWATPGFVAGPLPSGEWSATLEVYEAILDLVYSLRVVALAHAPAPRVAPRQRTLPPPHAEFPRPAPEGWMRGELHTHSTASDGFYEPRELVERAATMGLDFLALTDHGTLSGLEALRDAPFTVIPGCEITTFRGHFLALGVAATPPWYEGERLLSAEELAAVTRAAGGIFGLAHPFVLGDPVCCGCRLDLAVPPHEIEVLEVWSRGFIDPAANCHALALFDELRRVGHRVVAIAGRDWHGPSQEQRSSGRRFPANVVRAPRGSGGASLLAALRRGACYLSVGPTADFALLTDGGRAELGEDLCLAPDGRLAARAVLDAVDEPCRVRLVCGGHVVREERLGPGSHTLEHDLPRPARGGVRLEVWTDDLAEALLITNPVEVVPALDSGAGDGRSSLDPSRGRRHS
jgi:hypothetical protein